MTFVAVLTGRTAFTIDGAMVSCGAVKAWTLVKENLSAIGDTCYFCTFGCPVIFTAIAGNFKCLAWYS